MKVAVVGSGPAGVSAAIALLKAGHSVNMLDYGNTIEASALELSEHLKLRPPTLDELVILRPESANRSLLNHLRKRGAPGLNLKEKTRLGSSFTFKDVEEMLPVAGVNAARSLARGGLSNIWGAGCYPLTETDYEAWPVPEHEMKPHYFEVAKLLSLSEDRDSLAKFYPLYSEDPKPFPLNESSARILAHAQRHLSAESGLTIGRSRLAVNFGPSPNSCTRCGLCMYGCPQDAIYRADWTLEKLFEYPNFTYSPGHLVSHFEEEGSTVWVHSNISRKCYDALFLAAGTLSSIQIVSNSLRIFDREIKLLDNDLYIFPLLRIVPLGRQPEFTLNEIAIRTNISGIPIHIQLYQMNEQIIDRFRPYLSAMPRFGVSITKHFLSRFMIAFAYLPGGASAEIRAIFSRSCISIRQTRNPLSSSLIAQLRTALWKYSRSTGLTPFGPNLSVSYEGPSGGHISSGLSMKQTPKSLEAGTDGLLFGTTRVYAVDGAALPILPAQNSTYTIMANAHRIGTDFREGNT